MTQRHRDTDPRHQPPLCNFYVRADGTIEVIEPPAGFHWPTGFDYYAPVIDRTGEVVAHTTFTCYDRRYTR
jgi:hypothetical protein